MEEHLDKKDKKEQKRLDKIASMESSQNGSKAKWIIIGVVALIFLGFLGYAISIAKNKPAKTVELTSSGWVKGNPESTVTFTEFADFQCPYCKQFAPIVSQLEDEYGDRVKIVFKHYPIKQAHPNAFPAAVAAEAAGRQNKFWEFHDILFEKQQDWDSVGNPTSKFVSYAKSLDLDTAQFEKDLGDEKLKAAVNAQSDEGIEAGVSGTPTIFINNTQIPLPRNFEELRIQIEEALPDSSPSAK